MNNRPPNNGHLWTRHNLKLQGGYPLLEVKVCYHTYGPVGTTAFVLYRAIKCIVSFIWSVLKEKFYCTSFWI